MYTKVSKYRARYVDVDNIRFDSRKEANKYNELKLLKMAGEILDFELQPEFELQPAFRDKRGKLIKPIKYRADFKVIYKDKSVVYIDTKGFETEVFKLKAKMLKFKYPDINFVVE